ncbi:MAG TPA: hypothetical protein PKD09_17780 [Aggregatilinea sp.]|uniref:hypothetical protein n=1 Tax=Aggregatilinea sp. TaxID=2806333 RepID=UPI002B5B20D7|nr:hypothetical protein [Aggregatilinea sp.]HML23511.1 hypothetical protein [Aggregatilinea sp.]
MWIRLVTRKTVLIAGDAVSYCPGDLIEVGGHLARKWIAAGDAVEAQLDLRAAVVPTAGIACHGSIDTALRDRLARVDGLRMSFHQDDWPVLPYTETLLWVPEFEPRLDLLVQGFKLLQQWQVAVPLWDYETLAAHVGSEEERAYTETIVRDLRVPLRDTRLIFARRCPDTRRLVATWCEERRRFEEGDDRLAFLRALYLVKPVICDLPNSWTNNGRKR